MTTPKNQVCLMFDHDAKGAVRFYADTFPTAAWEALTPGKRRGLLHPISSAKRAETRAKRIANLTGAP
tara:strand:- start:362 stop:565 length:204 start_codon:yes stop_codon:yes gene_type:complete